VSDLLLGMECRGVHWLASKMPMLVVDESVSPSAPAEARVMWCTSSASIVADLQTIHVAQKLYDPTIATSTDIVVARLSVR
jgi:hypothetical protein